MKFAACEFVVAPLNGSQVCSHRQFSNKWFALHVGTVYQATEGKCCFSHTQCQSQFSYYEFNAHMPCSCINYSGQRNQPSLLADELFFLPVLLVGHQKHS